MFSMTILKYGRLNIAFFVNSVLLHESKQKCCVIKEIQKAGRDQSTSDYLIENKTRIIE